jgi:hypothetical protein
MYGNNSVGSNMKIASNRVVEGVCQTPPQPRETIITNITEQLNGRLGTLHALNSRLVSLSDRLLGARPEDGSTSGTGTSPTCQVENLGACVPFLDYLLDQLDAQVKRLEQL